MKPPALVGGHALQPVQVFGRQVKRGSGSALEAFLSTIAYRVHSGDTLSNIAMRFNTTAQELRRINGLISENCLRVGQVLRIPTSAVKKKPSARTAPVVDGVPLYAQCDARWGSLALGTKRNIRGYGCALTAAAMAFSKIVGRPVTPGDLDVYLDKHQGPSQGSQFWDMAASSCGLGATWPFPAWELKTIDEELQAGRPVVVGVDERPLSKSGRWDTAHWVVLTAKRKDKGRTVYAAHDPDNAKPFLFKPEGTDLRVIKGSGITQDYRTTGQLCTFFVRRPAERQAPQTEPKGKNTAIFALGGPDGPVAKQQAPKQRPKTKQQDKPEDNPYRKQTIKQRAEKIGSLLEPSLEKFISRSTGFEIRQVFQASESFGEFLALQDLVDMEEVFDECSNWDAIQLGAIGPVDKARDALNEKRADYIVESIDDYGHDLAQVFIFYIFNNMYGDDIRAVLSLLAKDKRLSRTLMPLTAIQENLKLRGIDLNVYRDRGFKGADIARAIGSGIGDFLDSSELSKFATSTRYHSQQWELPKEYQEVLGQIETALVKEIFTPKNLALGTFDYLTLGIPLGLYHLVSGTLHGLKELVAGDAEQGINELVPALLLVVSALGVKAYRVARSTGTPLRGSALTGPRGSGQFVVKGYSGPLSQEAARIGAMLQLNVEAQAAAGFITERYGQQGISTLAGYMRADSKLVRFIHEKGIPGIEALLKAKGDLAKAQRLLKTLSAGYLPEANPPRKTAAPQKQPKVPTKKPVVSGVPKGWENFVRELDGNFKIRLQQFRGDTNLKPPKGLVGGEGQLFLSEKLPGKTLKRWFKSRLSDMATSVKKLQEAEAAVEANHRLRADIKVVKITERGPDWVLRDFDSSSVELSKAMSNSATSAAYQRVVTELQRMKSVGKLSPVLEDLLKKLTRAKGPSNNIHWSPDINKLVVIDLM